MAKDGLGSADGGNPLGNSLLGYAMMAGMYSSRTDIYLDNVTLGYDRHPAVHHMSIEIAQGSLIAVVGPNGSGKSTLLRGLVGELRPLEGHIFINQSIAYLPQLREVDRSFPISVHDFVGMGLWRSIGAWGNASNADPSY